MDGIIFDVDGTLWDSTDSVAESWNQAIHENSDLDIEINRTVLSNLFGKTMDEICNALFPQLSAEEKERLGSLCFEYENRFLETNPGQLYDGVADTIKELAKHTNLYIVSNCQCGYIEVFLKTTGLSPYIKDYLCFGQTLTSKGRTIRTLMTKNHLEDVVYVGDTQGDANACIEANVPFIFAEYGFGEVPDAKRRIAAFTELLDCFSPTK